MYTVSHSMEQPFKTIINVPPGTLLEIYLRPTTSSFEIPARKKNIQTISNELFTWSTALYAKVKKYNMIVFTVAERFRGGQCDILMNCGKTIKEINGHSLKEYQFQCRRDSQD